QELQSDRIASASIGPSFAITTNMASTIRTRHRFPSRRITLPHPPPLPKPLFVLANISLPLVED
ncbi:hypothetical protein OS493_033470, partial [Desmophyllum pertusum]